MILETKVHACHKCGSKDLTKNGMNACGNQQYHCKTCGAYGVLDPRERYPEEEKGLILKAYQERPSMRGIERSHGVCRQTLVAWLKKAAPLPPPETTLTPVVQSKHPCWN